MTRLKNNPRFSLVFSLLLLVLTYAVEGFLYGPWIYKLIEKKSFLTYIVEDSVRIMILYGGAVLGISLVVILLTSPVLLITIGLNNWLKSDTRSFLSIFLAAFAFAIIVQRIDLFARFLVLIAAVFLGKLDLQLVGFSRWLSSVILVVLCCFGFTGGILAFYEWKF
ncbi:MAG: hypothetical protein HC939_10895 [Pleurocapsa sp. SU_5_0]|nr:hypothetical protein [Pleurocapsa sp. SU_5_0]NJR47679.1 hypothetical protein [Hyellaceae cyanobacterium CSU_1_1]